MVAAGPVTDRLAALAAQWRTEGDILEANGAPGPAMVKRRDAEQLTTVVQEMALEALTLRQAGRESGYSYSALEKMVRDGRLPNAGAPNRPRIRRVDLPRKPPGRNGPGPDLAGLILDGEDECSQIGDRYTEGPSSDQQGA